ncbi:MAG: hypothetical protein H0V89_11640, partial [Deltaproteobacteria bacterium]|nr:hypothetical protein [Deltaproteobacteria bacterium]
MAWGWMLLAGVTLVLHPALVAFAISAGWLAPFVLPVELGVAREVVLALLGVSLLAFVTVPAGAAFATGMGFLERRAWSPVAAFVFVVPALVLAPPLGLLVGALTVWTLWDSATRARLTAEGDAPLGWRVGAVVRLHDKPVSESSGDAASGLDLGQALPAQAGGRQPMLAWSARDRVALVDDTGAEYIVDPQHPAVLRRGSVAVAVSVMPELRVRRWRPLSAIGSLVLLAVFLGATVGVGQGE